MARGAAAPRRRGQRRSARPQVVEQDAVGRPVAEGRASAGAGATPRARARSRARRASPGRRPSRRLGHARRDEVAVVDVARVGHAAPLDAGGRAADARDGVGHALLPGELRAPEARVDRAQHVARVAPQQRHQLARVELRGQRARVQREEHVADATPARRAVGAARATTTRRPRSSFMNHLAAQHARPERAPTRREAVRRGGAAAPPPRARPRPRRRGRRRAGGRCGRQRPAPAPASASRPRRGTAPRAPWPRRRAPRRAAPQRPPSTVSTKRDASRTAAASPSPLGGIGRGPLLDAGRRPPCSNLRARPGGVACYAEDAGAPYACAKRTRRRRPRRRRARGGRGRRCARAAVREDLALARLARRRARDLVGAAAGPKRRHRRAPLWSSAGGAGERAALADAQRRRGVAPGPGPSVAGRSRGPGAARRSAGTPALARRGRGDVRRARRRRGQPSFARPGRRRELAAPRLQLARPLPRIYSRGAPCGC